MTHRLRAVPSQVVVGIALVICSIVPLAFADAGGSCQTVASWTGTLGPWGTPIGSWNPATSCSNGVACPIGCKYQWTTDGYKYCVPCAATESEPCNLGLYNEPPAAITVKCIRPVCPPAKPLCALGQAENMPPVDNGDGTFTWYASCICQ